jgi:copper chaperone CopZ
MPFCTGVTEVDASVEEKKVVVTGAVTAEQCLTALKPWSEASGKSIGTWE